SIHCRRSLAVDSQRLRRWREPAADDRRKSGRVPVGQRLLQASGSVPRRDRDEWQLRRALLLKRTLRRQRLFQQSRRLSFEPERRPLSAVAAESRFDPDHVRTGKLRSSGTQSRTFRHPELERHSPHVGSLGTGRGPRLAVVAQDAALCSREATMSKTRIIFHLSFDVSNLSFQENETERSG